MKQDNVRNYITAAFRFYAKVGGYEKYKSKIGALIAERIQKSEGCSTDISKPTEAQVIKREAELELYKADFLDLLAVENTKKRIEQGNLRYKDLVWPVVERVYMADPDRPMERNDITNRVTKCDIELNISPTSTYKYLATARYIFASERGLRVDK